MPSFIFRDVESLRSRLPVSVITLYGRNLRHCSEEMKEAARDVHTMGTAALPTILASFFITLCRHPLRLLHAAGKSLLYRWKSLETFGENLWAFLCGVHLARTLKEAGIDARLILQVHDELASTSVAPPGPAAQQRRRVRSICWRAFLLPRLP